MGIINQDGSEKKLFAEELKIAAREMRGYNLISLCCAGSGHSGGTLSAMDYLAVLYLNVMKHKPYNPDWDERDRIFFSAGHKAPAWYVSLGYSGYFDIKETATLRKLHSKFQGHPDRKKCPGVELSSGSLGQGISVALGSALAGKLDGKDYRVFVVSSDGEQQEGEVWEAVMSAAHYKLDNFCVIIDKNRLQIDGWIKDVMDIDPLDEKYKAFGFHVIKCNGHSIEELLRAFHEAETTKGKPSVIICDTVKGKGISFMEDKAGWHGKPPKKDELELALKELNCEHLPKDEMFKISEGHQKKIDLEIESMMPKFSRNYWWNFPAIQNMKVDMKATRMGFGEEMEENPNENIVAIGADISESIQISKFYEKHPERKKRFFSLGIAEQNCAAATAGFAKEGKIPVFGTYGVFSAGRDLDQLRTSVCYPQFNSKIVGAHGGISVGPDGPTHQALEELFQIAGLPNMNVLAPCDAPESKKATHAMLDEVDGPCYIRLTREATPTVTTASTPYKFGIATVIHFRGEKEKFIDAFEHKLSTDLTLKNENEDITIVSFGPELAESMRAAWILKEEFGITARVINMSTIKPLDKKAVIDAAKETGAILVCEEHQIGGLSNLVAAAIIKDEKLQNSKSVVFDAIGIPDRFGETGASWELIKYFGLSAEHIAKRAKEMVDKKKHK